MSDTDISSLNNSTDDPEYNIEQESGNFTALESYFISRFINLSF